MTGPAALTVARAVCKGGPVPGLTAGTARPVFHTMLYGNATGQPYGWATPDETGMMLAAGTLGPETCPPAAGGHRHDWYLVPSPGDLHFWLARLLQRGRHDLAGELLDRHVPGRPDPGPEVTFYTGAHHPSWLWSGQVRFPLCVSYGTLRKVRQPRRGRVPWILDSRGFSELSQHGRWTIPAEDYVRDVARYDAVIGGLQWAAPQDWMCEDAIIHGGTGGRVHCVGTGLSVAEHQRRTVANFRELTSLWPHYSDRPCPFIPVLQGDTPASYLRCYQMYLDAGVELGDEYRLAGVGSVCRLQSTRQISALARTLGPLNLGLHWFGLKLTGLKRPEILRDITSPYVYDGTRSLDSATWSLDARHGTRLPGCTHVSRKTGLPSKCNNCPRYATRWQGRVAAAITAAETSAARRFVQGELFGPGQFGAEP